jgi:ubiquinol-cytochrome c reductase cytochrome b subunit
VQINPIWQWGPYAVGAGTNGAQPDWYLGWLIGALRLMPSFDVTVGSYTLVPNPFWGGVLFPIVVLTALAILPWVERRITGDHAFHNVLERPRDAPRRTAFGMAFVSLVFVVLIAGSADRIYLFLNWSYATQIWVYRVAVVVLPIAVYFVTRRTCRELQVAETIEERREDAEREARLAGAQPAGPAVSS